MSSSLHTSVKDLEGLYHKLGTYLTYLERQKGVERENIAFFDEICGTLLQRLAQIRECMVGYDTDSSNFLRNMGDVCKTKSEALGQVSMIFMLVA